MGIRRICSIGGERAVAPVIGITLVVAITVLLSATVALVVFDLAEDTEETADEFEVLVEDRCPGDDTVTYESGDFGQIQQQLADDPCALWLEAGDVETDGDGNVVRWNDQGVNDFHATQTDDGFRPELIEGERNGEDVIRFHGDNDQTGEDRGDYLELDRDVSDLGLEEDTGMVVISVMYVEEFDRGGTWTIGEAGQDGREFSMRTCSDRSNDGCQESDPAGHWRAQHWGSADIDFYSEDTDGEWFVLVHAYDGDEGYVRVNGEELQRQDIDLDLSGDRDIQLARWERTDGDPDWYHNGDMAEVIIFDRDMDDEEIEVVEEYMMTKFDIEE